MLVNCNSCQKKFTVPDSAITEAGRLLQCGSCGNKWTQYPIKQESSKVVKPKKELMKTITSKLSQAPKVNKIKTTIKKKKREINLYSEEYLKKKYGLKIGGDQNNKENKKIISNSYFFNYFVVTTIFIISTFGVLNLIKDNMIEIYPSTESYINSLYEVIEILKITILNLIS